MTLEIQNDKETPAKATGKALPLVAVVGQPNVGKSTLFNRLIGQRRSIVGDEPGITRDRTYGEAASAGQRSATVATGGIAPDDAATIPAIFQAGRLCHRRRAGIGLVVMRVRPDAA